MLCGNCRREIAEHSNFCYFCGSRQSVGAAAPPKRLMRSSTDSKIAGVCGGFAEYMDTDSTLIRLIFAVVVFCTGIVPGIFVYLLCWLIMPVAPVPLPAGSPAAAPQPAPHAS